MDPRLQRRLNPPPQQEHQTQMIIHHPGQQQQKYTPNQIVIPTTTNMILDPRQQKLSYTQISTMMQGIQNKIQQPIIAIPPHNQAVKIVFYLFIFLFQHSEPMALDPFPPQRKYTPLPQGHAFFC